MLSHSPYADLLFSFIFFSPASRSRSWPPQFPSSPGWPPASAWCFLHGDFPFDLMPFSILVLMIFSPDFGSLFTNITQIGSHDFFYINYDLLHLIHWQACFPAYCHQFFCAGFLPFPSTQVACSPPIVFHLLTVFRKQIGLTDLPKTPEAAILYHIEKRYFLLSFLLRSQPAFHDISPSGYWFLSAMTSWKEWYSFLVNSFANSSASSKTAVIDRPKIRVQNSKHNCITQSGLDKKIEYVETQINAYLMVIEKDGISNDDFKEKPQMYQDLKKQ